jgi:hypothetical protein
MKFIGSRLDVDVHYGPAGTSEFSAH